jgi:predicted membrane protein
MANEEKKGFDWIAVIFIFIVLPVAFTVGGTWVGIAILVVGIVAFGWTKRNEGPFLTNKSEKDC